MIAFWAAPSSVAFCERDTQCLQSASPFAFPVMEVARSRNCSRSAISRARASRSASDSGAAGSSSSHSSAVSSRLS